MQIRIQSAIECISNADLDPKHRFKLSISVVDPDPQGSETLQDPDP
jgi:hypothetical protein